MFTPRLEIHAAKIFYNAKKLLQRCQTQNIDIMAVTKVVQGEPYIASILVDAGIKWLGDSRIDNIKKIRKTGVKAKFALIRAPLTHQLAETVQYTDLSFNSELFTIRKLSQHAKQQDKIHNVVLMVDLGDRREGVLPQDAVKIVKEILTLPNICLSGIATNLSCLNGVEPDEDKMHVLSQLVEEIEQTFNIHLDIVSGGNSANIEWLLARESAEEDRVNQLRLGGAILLGREALTDTPIPGFYYDTVTLVAEVIECKMKPALPEGNICQNNFGYRVTPQETGLISRVVLGLGLQDVSVKDLIPIDNDIEILGATSDHTVLHVKSNRLHVGDEVHFHVDYGALLAAMTSPYVEKHFTEGNYNIPFSSYKISDEVFDKNLLQIT